MAGKTLRFYNLTGGLNTVQDLATINSTPNRTETPDMYNIEYYKLGGIQSMRGNIPYGQKLNGSITCGYEYLKDDNIYNVITTSENKLYRYSFETTSWTFLSNIYSGDVPIEATRHSIAGFADGIVATDGTNFVYYKKDRKDLVGEGTFGQSDTADYVTFNGTTVAQWYIDMLNSGGINTIGMSFLLEQYGLKSETSLAYVQGLKQDGTVVQLNGFTNLPKDIVNSRLVFSIKTVGVFDNKNDISVYITEEVTHFSPTFKNVTGEGVDLIDKIPIRGLAINSYKGRLWIGTEDGKLFYSALGTFYDFNVANDAGAFANFEEDTSNITALGRWSEYLVLHKRHGSYIIDANDADTTKWLVKPYSENTCESQQSFINTDEGYFIYSRKKQGILPLLSRSLYNTLYQSKEVTTKIKTVFEELNTNALNQIYITYHPIKQYILFYMPFNDGNGYSNKCYVFDLLTKTWLLRIVPQKVTCAFMVNNSVYIGTEDGYILKEFLGDTFFIGYNNDGTIIEEPIPFSYTTPSFMWGGGTNKTTTSEFRTKLQNLFNNNFYIESIRDGHGVSKTRHIRTGEEGGNTLFWDSGLSQANINPDAEFKEVPIYQYQGDDDITYYCTSPNITATTLNVLMFKELVKDGEKYYELKRLAGLNQDITYTIPGTPDDYTDIKYGQTQVYGWRERIISNKAYRNGSWIAWISDGVPYALVNIKVDKRRVYTYYGVRTRLTNTTTQDFRLSPSLYNRIVTSQQQGSQEVFLPSSYDMYFKYNNAYVKSFEQVPQPGYPYQTYQRGLAINIIGDYIHPNGDVSDYELNYAVAYRYNEQSIKYYDNVSSQGGGTNPNWGQLIRNTADDLFYDESYEVPNGSYNINNTVQRLYTAGANDTITISINNSNVVFTRFPSGDVGYYSDTPVYTKEAVPGVTAKVYADKDCKILFGTVTAITQDTITLDNGKVLYRYTGGNTIAVTETYYKTIHTTFTKVGDEPIGYQREGYEFPDTEDKAWNKTLTNTVWDENTWSSERFITKRFLLSNQYFETIQYRFFGNSKDNSLCMAGFEIDGIQLTEVPH